MEAGADFTVTLNGAVLAEADDGFWLDPCVPFVLAHWPGTSREAT